MIKFYYFNRLVNISLGASSILLLSSSLLSANTQSTYPATVEDGTQKEISVKQDLEKGAPELSSDLDSALVIETAAPDLKEVKEIKAADELTADLISDLPKIETKKTEITAVKKETSVTVAAEKKSETEIKTIESNYDIVPTDKVSQISERMKYAYEILKKHGRAYDYRSTTLKELKKTLVDLDIEMKKKKS